MSELNSLISMERNEVKTLFLAFKSHTKCIITLTASRLNNKMLSVFFFFGFLFLRKVLRSNGVELVLAAGSTKIAKWIKMREIIHNSNEAAPKSPGGFRYLDKIVIPPRAPMFLTKGNAFNIVIFRDKKGRIH